MATISILGTDCPKCLQLHANVLRALQDSDAGHTVTKIRDIEQIVSLGVMMIPGLMVDGRIVSTGKVLTVEQIRALL